MLESAEPAKAERPWVTLGGATGLPTNARSGNRYQGVNILSLWCATQAENFTSMEFATYRQWAELGGQVRKGQHGSPVVF